MRNKDEEYMKVVDEAERDFDDAVERGIENSTVDAMEFINGLMTPEEKAEHDLRVALMLEFIDARKDKAISQKQLAEITKTKQSVISRFETGRSDSCVCTILKALEPLGKKLAIVDI